MSEEPLFDPSLKKRKKKAVQFTEDPLGAEADPTTPAPETIDNVTTTGEKEDDDLKAMFGDMKKKKKKKELPMDLGEADSGTSTPKEATATEDLDFSDIKKKKKSSKKKAAFDLEAFEKELNESKKDGAGSDDEDAPDGESNPNLNDDGDLGDDPFAQPDAPTGVESGNEAWLNSDRDYLYPELLGRFYSLLHAANPALLSTSAKRYTIAPPSIHREGNKKSIFANISDICKRMHRQPEHVIQFLFSEMGTTGSVDGAGRLVIKGRFQQKQVENVLRRYIVEYVTCKTCKSPDTLLTKENRIFFMACESCGSRRSVNAIKSGFQAQVGKRSKNRPA
ncbi:translation initiation factor eIF-2 beta subunit [Marasmius tenuissimus]|uniref:Translation initiation factor eIF-2 beta subunit n=1 Tax=Marasmius tenuissimus TaxID=585030 RepID=A0ABR2ZUC4_9AGAR